MIVLTSPFPSRISAHVILPPLLLCWQELYRPIYGQLTTLKVELWLWAAACVRRIRVLLNFHFGLYTTLEASLYYNVKVIDIE